MRKIHYYLSMDSALLKTFLVLAETKNFTQAARRLYRSQSAISLQIARLESLLKNTLFVRDNRNVTLTLEGEQLLGFARQILKLEQEMLHHFQEPQLAGEVTFGTPEDLATAYLPGILSDFVSKYPSVFLNVHCELTMDLLKGFESHQYDLALIKQDPEHPHPKSEVVWKESLVWVSNGFHADCKKKEPIPLVLAPSPCVYRQRAIDTLNQAGLYWRIVYTSPSLAGALAAVQAGLGISVLPTDRIPTGLHVIDHLPAIKDAQIALLKQANCSHAVVALAKYIVDRILSDEQ